MVLVRRQPKGEFGRCPCALSALLALHLLLMGPIAEARSGSADPWTIYIKENARDLSGPEDLQSVTAMLKPHDLVLLGETTHGTHEYYVWRAEISKALISEAGFRFIAVEGDWSAIDRLDQYVRHRGTQADSAGAVLQTFDRWAEWMWANPVIEELAEWLHSWNAGRPFGERVGIHGIDVYGWGDSVEQLPDYLEALEPGWGKRAAEGLAPLRGFEGDSRAFSKAVMNNQPTGAEKLARIINRMEQESESLSEADPQAWMQARQKASLIRQAKRHLRKQVQNHPRSWNPRAENFMHTVERLRDYYGKEAKGIVWAHNTHVGDARFTPMRGAGLVTIGQLAREALGEDQVFILGFASDEGTFRAGRHWGEPGGSIMPLPTALGDTFDAYLRDAAPHTAFLSLAGARENADFLIPLGHRAIGIVHTPPRDPRRSYVPSIIPLRYDGVLFIRKTNALSELNPEAKSVAKDNSEEGLPPRKGHRFWNRG